jgi:AAA domain
LWGKAGGHVTCDDCGMSMDAMHGYSVASTQKKKPSGENDEDRAPLDWVELTTNVVNGVSLHDSTRDLAASWIGVGMDPAHVLRLLHALMEASLGPKDERFEERRGDLPRLVRDAKAKFGKPEQDTELAFADMRGWDETKPPARQWWLEDRFPLRQPSLVSGQGAIGKSILLLQLLTSTSLSTRWLDLFTPTPGPTIYLSAEDEEDDGREQSCNARNKKGFWYHPADAKKGSISARKEGGNQGPEDTNQQTSR